MSLSGHSRQLSHSTTDDEVQHDETLAITIGVILVLFSVALAIGQWLHHRHIYWLPESGTTIIVGFVAGLLISYMDVEKDFPFFDQDVTPGLKDMLVFNHEFFTLFLLPPIIFEAGYSFQIYKRNLGRILTLAFIGTLLATALTWGALHLLNGAGALPRSLNTTEEGQFAALISAVDPVGGASLHTARASPRPWP